MGFLSRKMQILIEKYRFHNLVPWHVRKCLLFDRSSFCCLQIDLPSYLFMKRIKLTALRKQHRLTQSALAALLGINVAAYGRIESGKGLLGIDLMLRLCDIYNCSIDALVGERADMDRSSAHHCSEEELLQLCARFMAIQEAGIGRTLGLMREMLEECKRVLQEKEYSVPDKYCVCTKGNN